MRIAEAGEERRLLARRGGSNVASAAVKVVHARDGEILVPSLPITTGRHFWT